MDIKELESYFPSFFTPIETLLYHSNDKIVSYSCSAFSLFFKTYDKLVDTIDNLTKEEKQKIRKNFLKFLVEATKGKKVF